MKLHVYLRNLGIASRRKAEEMIAEKLIEVNGELAHIGQQVEGNEKITVNGQEVGSSPSSQKYYLLVNKPVGYTSTTVDFYTNEKSVLELLPYELKKLAQWQIVGRLDKNSEGLVLLTNDGALGYILTHPKFQVEKEYEVTTSKELKQADLLQLTKGVVSDAGEEYRFKTIKKIGMYSYKCTLTEGKKREIREAIAVIGGHVARLIRVRLGELMLGKLVPGENKLLLESEAIELQAFAQRVSDSVLKQVKPESEGIL